MASSQPPKPADAPRPNRDDDSGQDRPETSGSGAKSTPPPIITDYASL